MCLEAGINLYDTADMYSQGESEQLIGAAFRDQRDKVFIATKGGYCLPGRRKMIARIKPLVRPLVKAMGLKRERLPASVSGSISQNFEPGYLQSAVEASLRRLRTDYIDLYQLHSPPPSVILRDDWCEALQLMKDQGKIRAFGIAADSPADAATAVSRGGISSVQVPFGLLDPEALTEVFPSASASGIGVIARGCFGGGLLKETLSPEELKAKTEKWERILTLRAEAQQKGKPVLQAALRYSLQPSEVSVTILGMHTPQHLRDILRMLA
jgi:aryl-alcohol dehydrogenase-like predicted oxidoreductase